jgi:hypothetical protein
MTTLHAITLAQHSNKSWKKPTDALFAKEHNVVSLVWNEIPQAMQQFPLAIMSNQGGYQLVAVLGLKPSMCAVVTEAGRWLADYVPAQLRHYPFKLAHHKAGGFVLCVDHASGLIQENSTGQPFIGTDKVLTAEIKAIGEQLIKLERERKNMSAQISKLAELKLLEPWPLQVKHEEQQWQIAGLQRINETALNAVTADVLKELQSNGSLTVCYAQLLSMLNMQRIARWTTQKLQAKAHGSNKEKANIKLADNSGTISFENL